MAGSTPRQKLHSLLRSDVEGLRSELCKRTRADQASVHELAEGHPPYANRRCRETAGEMIERAPVAERQLLSQLNGFRFSTRSRAAWLTAYEGNVSAYNTV